MKNVNKGIDFIVVSYYKSEYIKILIESVRRYVDYPYLITVVANEKIDSKEYKDLVKTYKKDLDVSVITGTNQESLEERGGIEGVKWTYDEYGNKFGPGSINHGKGLTIGMKNTNNEYICFLDNDAIFLNKWVDYILPLLDESFFVSNRMDKGIAREMFMMFKRKEFQEHNLYPNATYVDNAGNITKYARDNKLPFIILGNSCFNENGEFHRNSALHLLDLPYGEQVYINDIPFFYHYGRGNSRDEEYCDMWEKETKKYLEIS